VRTFEEDELGDGEAKRHYLIGRQQMKLMVARGAAAGMPDVVQTNGSVTGPGRWRASRRVAATRPFELVGIALVSALIALVSLVAAGSAWGSVAVPSRSADKLVNRALRALVAMPSGPPGAVAVIQRGRSFVLHRAGVGDLRTGRPIGAFEHMRLASVAKAFNGAVALALVARGRLSLDDTIGRLLPWLPGAWWPVTLRQMLDHTSGLPDYTGTRAWQQALNTTPHATPPPAWLLAYSQREPLVFKPGSRYAYSNSDNNVVGLMIQAATDRSYEHELAALVFRPLGLRQTSLPASFRLSRPYVHGYGLPSPSREDVSQLVSGAWVQASGAVVSTPFELNRFIRAYVGRKLFGRAVQAQQLRLVAGHSEPIGPGQNRAGMGIFRYRTRCGTVYGHTGNFFGYTQFAAASLDGRRSVTVSVNEQLNEGLVGRGLAVFKRLRAAEETAVCAALAR
jgi:D-alanyl-D-alanine carboxypeptidase